MPIDPAMLTVGGDWSIGIPEAGLQPPAAPGSSGGASFGQIMADQVEQLSGLQTDAAGASRDLALGKASDPTEAVLAVERARLAMQLAVSVRGKLTEAVQTIMHTQV